MKSITKPILAIATMLLLFSCQSTNELMVKESKNDLHFTTLAQTWDEGMPLGNAIVGSLVWEKDGRLRMSLDRADLWDLRPVDSLSGDNYKFSWINEQVDKGDYLPVQKKFDHPYDKMPAPSKIPGAGLEFSMDSIGEPNSVRLMLDNGVCDVKWANGMRLQTFVHATEPIGWFVVQNADETFIPNLLPPAYERTGSVEDLGPVSGLDLSRLGYRQGEVTKEGNLITYHQKGWDDYYYDVAVKWEQRGADLVGVWSVTSSLVDERAVDLVAAALERGVAADYKTHNQFWGEFWAQSSINLPDTVLQKQYEQEMYKFGSATREDSYPISLQAVWTADNGNLPPWKGDYHHDLNTQLSYWPTYIGNQLTLGEGYLNTLWNQREFHQKFAKDFYDVDGGLNVPGVATLTGEPMGGWIQYALSPTTAAWLSQHFYLHYKYSKDKEFLENRAYPYVKDVATFLEQITIINDQGERTLAISSSPEIYDNSLQAWFRTITNYDLALISFCFGAAEELAADLNLDQEADHWGRLKDQMPEYDIEESGAMTFAKGFPYNSSHRHFSNTMAIHPLGLIDWSQGGESQRIIEATIDNLDKVGPGAWTGYSYSWLANMKARAMDGEGAAEALRTFAECFCLKNTFHVNGDQSGTGKSGFTYRPFTLEGNFAFAAGVQEMLLQSHTETILVFPAIPESWKDVSFDQLRAVGAFLVSADKVNGKLSEIKILSEKGGECKLALADASSYEITGSPFEIESGVLIFDTKEGDEIEIKQNTL